MTTNSRKISIKPDVNERGHSNAGELKGLWHILGKIV